jgi:hypothetical protein
MRRIHVTGCSPRSGTTLMMALVVHGFAIDAHCDHEITIFEPPPKGARIYCSKDPGDARWIAPLVDADPNLWVIYMLRDPRDVIVSMHREDPGKYWSHLRWWKEFHHAAMRATSERFITVKYEELVRDPARVQAMLLAKMPFLEKRAEFADYHLTAKPSDRALAALSGLRAISDESIGAWRKHRPRVAAQIAMHGPIAKELVALGYEKDDAWLGELAHVVPNNHETHWPDFDDPKKIEMRRVRAEERIRMYLAAIVI